MVGLLEGGIELLGGKGGGLRLRRRLPIECVFTNTFEEEGIVWRRRDCLE